MRVETAWALGGVLAVIAGGCLSPKASRCGDGRVCPANTRCDVVNSRCVGPQEEEACVGHIENQRCVLIGAPGRCKKGVCTPLFCGDDMLSGNEECDGTNLDGKTCASQGYYDQTTGLACTSECKFDFRGCKGHCGDHVINGTEQCDGENLGGADCRQQGFYASAGLKCSASCTFDPSACTGRCGDGIVDSGEACDGAPPAGKSCVDFGFDRGLLACSNLCAPVLDGCRAFGWTSMVSPGRKALGRMWASGPDDVFAIDADATSVLHWDGVRWSPMSTGAEPATLASIWGSASNDVYVVGEWQAAGIIRHWDGATWSRVQVDLKLDPDVFQPGGGYLSDVWGTGPNDVFAVGSRYGGVALHWDGARWSIRDFPGAAAIPALGRLWGSGPNDVFATGGSGIVHWDGTGWSKVWEAVGVVWPFFDVAGGGPHDVLAAGPSIDGSSVGSAVMHWDGAAWSPAPLGAVVSQDRMWEGELHDVFFLGVKTSQGEKSSVTYRWNGRSWDKVALKSPGKLTFGGTFPGGVIASGDDGTVRRWDYTTWSADGVMANGVWSHGANDAIAAGANALFHWDGGGWFAMATAKPLLRNMAAVWGARGDDAWAVGELGTILHWDGSIWSAAVPNIPSVFLRAVWGSASDDVYVVGDGGTILHWNGRDWTLMPIASTQDLSGVWGSGPSDIYAVGPDKGGKHVILRFDGTAWAVAFSSPTPLRAVWGSGAGDVFVGGDGGTILHADGTGWTKMETRSTQTIFGLGGSGPSDVFAAADKTLLHLRDQAWEQIALPGSNQLRGVSASPSRVFVVGALPENHLDRNVSCVGRERACTDGWDNDCDGLADAADADCGRKAVEICANLADDDHDGKVDCVDPDCADFSSCKKR